MPTSLIFTRQKKTILLKIVTKSVTKNRSFERFLFYSSRSVVMSSGSGVIGDGVPSAGLFSAVSLVNISREEHIEGCFAPKYIHKVEATICHCHFAETIIG